MFIKLTLHSTNEILYFNIDYIVGFCIDGNHTAIDILDTTYRIKETPEEILKLIKECEK
jgi:hypothetical protein